MANRSADRRPPRDNLALPALQYRTAPTFLVADCSARGPTPDYPPNTGSTSTITEKSAAQLQQQLSRAFLGKTSQHSLFFIASLPPCSYPLLFSPYSPCRSSITHEIMATSLRLGASALRSSQAIASPAVQSAAFNGLRCYSTGKAKVCSALSVLWGGGY